MPIGKNAINRVKNNGYSNVKTSAPDMENSSVITKPDAQVVEKMIAPVEKATAKKAAAKKAPAKKSAAKKTTSTAKKVPAKKAPVENIVTEDNAKEGFERVSCGQDMPYYLL
jgi:hypothetical protein